jgi:hypothetical protein
MSQSPMKIRLEEPQMEPASTGDRYAAFVEQLGLEGDYLPSRDDQSWRELESLRGVVPDRNEDEIPEEPANIDYVVEPDDFPEPHSTGPGLKGTIFAFCAVTMIGLAIVAFTAPGLLTPGFWRLQRAAANSIAQLLAPSTASVHAPAMMQASATPPPVAPAPSAVASPAPPPQPEAAPAINPDLSATPTTDAAPAESVQAAAPKPVPRPVLSTAPRAKAAPPVLRTAARDKPVRGNAMRNKVADRDTGGFHAMVVGQDGTLEYRYFPSNPSR